MFNKQILNFEIIIATQIEESLDEEILNNLDNKYYLNDINDSNFIISLCEKNI